MLDLNKLKIKLFFASILNIVKVYQGQCKLLFINIKYTCIIHKWFYEKEGSYIYFNFLLKPKQGKI